MTYGVVSVVAVVLCSPILVGILLTLRARASAARRPSALDSLRIFRGPSAERPAPPHDPLPGEQFNPPRVSVVLPALNEEGAVQWVLEHIPDWVSEIVLVDGRSVDATEAVARTAVPELVVVHQHKPGKGAALRAGFTAATGEIIVMLDSDGSTDPAEMETFVRALQRGADFVKGSRHAQGGGSADLTLLRGLGNRGLVTLANRLHGCGFTDLCYGYCAFWRRNLRLLEVAADGFEIETALILSAVRAGLKIEEIPSMELPRRAGSSNLNAFRDGQRVLRTIFESRRALGAAATPRATHLELVPVEVASPELPQWRPAGKDRRRSDRRVVDPAAAGYTGPDRRRGDRRSLPELTVTVYRAVERPAAPVSAPEGDWIATPAPGYPAEEPAAATL